MSPMLRHGCAPVSPAVVHDGQRVVCLKRLFATCADSVPPAPSWQKTAEKGKGMLCAYARSEGSLLFLYQH